MSLASLHWQVASLPLETPGKSKQSLRYIVFLFPTYNEEFESQIYEVFCLGNFSWIWILPSKQYWENLSSWAFLFCMSPPSHTTLTLHFRHFRSPNVWAFPPTKSYNTVWIYHNFHHSNSILRVSTWTLCQINRLRAQAHKPTSILLQVPVPRFPSTSVWFGYRLEILTTSLVFY